MLTNNPTSPGDIEATSANLLRHDAPAGIVVFLVALPLCLGIALASGAPPLAGIIASVVGAIVVGLLSGSQMSVAGPAAGMTVFVVTSIQSTGSWRGFLAVLVLAGVIQILFGLLRFGAIANYVPNSVIRGMLAAIGIVLILKQIPHALGRDMDYEGNFSFLGAGGNTTITDILDSVMSASAGASLIFSITFAVLVLWEWRARRYQMFRIVPGPLVAVVLAIIVNQILGGVAPHLQIITKDHLVSLPALATVADFLHQFAIPDFTALGNPKAWVTAGILAVLASTETLLSLEASDRLDPYKRISPPNRELCAQGVGNIVCGLIGGLPITSVVLRTSANAYSGARTWMSTVTHGVLLLAAVLFVPRLLMLTPLACLAALLILIGFKLTSPSIYMKMLKLGWDQFIPFIVTVLAVCFTDLLTGVIVGFGCGLFFVFRKNHHEAITVVNDGSNYLFRFTKDASFVNKNELRHKLRKLPANSSVVIDGTRALFIDHDIMNVVEDFQKLAPYKNIQIELKNWQSYQL